MKERSTAEAHEKGSHCILLAKVGYCFQSSSSMRLMHKGRIALFPSAREEIFGRVSDRRREWRRRKSNNVGSGWVLP